MWVDETERQEAVKDLVREALAEDDREGSRFDADGFSNFFPEHDPEIVEEAWAIYDGIRNGTITDFV